MESIQKYPLQDLLNVRVVREEESLKAWSSQKEVVATVEKELVTQRQELEDYKKWRVQRENELFEQIINQTIHSKDLEDMRFRIQCLRDDQGKLESQVLETVNRLEQEKQALEEAKQHYYEVFRQRDKLDEHKATWIIEASKKNEYLEEKEIEDFRSQVGLIAVEGV